MIMKNMFFVLNDGISKKVDQVAQKHTALRYFQNLEPHQNLWKYDINYIPQH